MSNTLEYAEYLNAVKAKTSELNSYTAKELPMHSDRTGIEIQGIYYYCEL
jgi:hypothetical protein